ncbi:hypothetical protein CC78DRAFT_617145 [Lojkania enalia]|uniref:Heterokaryon incompatibility domain-containing protein n=1 Tax=Lojkania enalia TaxID=147567 RepID=A0A9P4N621_9PLEO|nr:hypothetical protein CC78DRAFT_617145 [Didymosphaeria enalia]
MLSERHTYFLLRQPLDPSAAGEFLGRFCANPSDPTIKFGPRDLKMLQSVLSAMLSQPLETIFSFQREGKDLGAPTLQARLAAVFRLEASREHILQINLNSGKATIRRAQQLDDYLDALLENQDIKKELLAMLKSNKGVAFMAAATLILEDAELTVTSSDKHIDRGELEAGGALAAAGLPPIPASIGGDRLRTQELVESQRIDGRKIFGVEYYKITKGSFWRKANAVNRASLPTSAGRLGVYGDGEDEDEDVMDDDISDISLEPLGDGMQEPDRVAFLPVNNDADLIGPTKNLSQTLPHLSRDSKTQFPLIDQICINQEDPIEKAKQVAMMARIYKAATGVLVWLGPEDESARLCKEWVIEVDKMLREMPHLDRMTPGNSTYNPDIRCIVVRSTFINPANDRKYEAAIRKFWTHPWFSRGWIVQEILLAKTETFFVGSVSFSIQNLADFLTIPPDRNTNPGEESANLDALLPDTPDELKGFPSWVPSWPNTPLSAPFRLTTGGVRSIREDIAWNAAQGRRHVHDQESNATKTGRLHTRGRGVDYVDSIGGARYHRCWDPDED